jgi:hypothetical protein
MKIRQILIAAVVAVLGFTGPYGAQAEPVRGDKLPSADTPAPAVTQSEMAIWVGEVELRGKKRLWVELIDRYGEVVYDSEIQPNETHILPDSSAIVVRRTTEGQFFVAKTITDRIPTDIRVVRTRRVVTDKDGVTTIEFLETKPAPASEPDNELIIISKAGQQIWATVVAFFSATVDTIRTAWLAVVDVFTA